MTLAPPSALHLEDPTLATAMRGEALHSAQPLALHAGWRSRVAGNGYAPADGVASVTARFATFPAADPHAPHATSGARASHAFDAVLSLARALEAKDPFTGLHSDRVADLAVCLARTLGWPAERARLLRQAGLVHDIGKIGVRDEILLKAEPLTDEEWDILRRHPVVGADIVAPILMPDQTAWVRGHHERWDGRGYPDRLAGHAIPHGARILAVADSFDAMTSIRAYRARMSATDAIEECRRQRGRQFAPRVVDALLHLAWRGAVPGLDLPTTGTVVPPAHRSREVAA
jgi:HD-GYP domain-containing protein (c-di-GMP phosphodiesterase class II)